jgi:hypothetical protein
MTAEELQELYKKNCAELGPLYVDKVAALRALQTADVKLADAIAKVDKIMSDYKKASEK